MSPKYIPPAFKRQVDPDELAFLISASIADGHKVSFNAPGGSMQPFIHSEDKIFISPVIERSIQSGDILVFVRTADNRVIAHRVIEIAGDRFLCKGDNVAEHNDGWISFEDILGRVEQVQRAGKPVRMGVKSGKRLIAWLSRKNRLVPLVNALRRVKWGMIRFFSPERRSKS